MPGTRTLFVLRTLTGPMRVAVLGAGYAGLRVARRLERSLPEETDIVVVDDTGTHVLQHEIHRVVRRPAIADVIEVPLADVLDRAAVRTARVTNVDAEAGVADLATGERLDYDYGAVCLGAATAFHRLPGVREHSTPLKTVADARAIRREFLDVCDAGGRVVVGGAGLSGVQIAGELTALARERDADDVEVVLVEQLDAVAPSFPAHFRDAVATALAEAGVDVRTGLTVTRASNEILEFERESLAFDQLVWTGGIAGREAMAGERPRVRDTLRHTDSTFVLGDAARVVDADGEGVPASAAAAVREAVVAADNIAALAGRDRTDPGAFDPRLDHYRFDVPGWIVSVGERTVAQVGPKILRGPAAKALKTTIGANQLSAVAELERVVTFVEEEFRA
jgi:NADH dehydrogenase